MDMNWVFSEEGTEFFISINFRIQMVVNKDAGEVVPVLN
jgi:hypothetical protein